MNARPRCCEWLPLSTQQLRLRNLQAIQAVNVDYDLHTDRSCSRPSSNNRCTEAMAYYTLHEHPENEAFYRSEKIAVRQQLPLKWAEIQCMAMVKSNANCVCIKVWMWTKKTDGAVNKHTMQGAQGCANNGIKEPISALTREFALQRKNTMPPDTLLFTWGIYFSGLIPLSNNSEPKCSTNSLILKMNDELFASPEQFATEDLRHQLALNYERYAASVPKCSVPTPDEFDINSPHVSPGSSPSALDWQRDLVRMSKTRYTHLNCMRSDVKQSYDLAKLLRLQQLQRQRLQTQRDIIDITADIKRLSLRCITKEQLLRKPRTTSINTSSSLSSSSTANQYHSMGRTLSLLLAEQQQIDPHQLLHAQRLQIQLETLKSKQRLLKSARNEFVARQKQLRQTLSASISTRHQLESWLKARELKLEQDMNELEMSRKNMLEQRQRRRFITNHMERRMSALCLELKHIYPISAISQGFITICGIPHPAAEDYHYNTLDPDKYIYLTQHITPMALTASLGYVAHLVEMLAVITQRPLRNPIIHDGGHMRVRDNFRDMSAYATRDFPLFSRSSIPTKAVKYAVHLLHQNVAQLYYDLKGNYRRGTIENIVRIFHLIEKVGRYNNEIRSSVGTLPDKRLEIHEINSASEIDDNEHGHFNHDTIKDGSDYSPIMEHTQPVTLRHSHPNEYRNNTTRFALTAENVTMSAYLNSYPINIERNSMQSNHQRISRSAGSYTDSEDELDALSPSAKVGCSNSDSNLTVHSGPI